MSFKKNTVQQFLLNVNCWLQISQLASFTSIIVRSGFIEKSEHSQESRKGERVETFAEAK